MKRVRLYLSLLSCVVFAVFMSGCANGTKSSGKSSHIDRDRSMYVMDDMGLEYNLAPQNNRIIASSENLPEKFAMCVVDTVTQVSVTVLDFGKEGVASKLEKNNVQAIVTDITQSNLGSRFEVRKNELHQASYLGKPAWHFKSEIAIGNPSEEIEVVYEGYIFDGSDGLCAIVATGQNPSPDLSPYLDRLRPLH